MVSLTDSSQHPLVDATGSVLMEIRQTKSQTMPYKIATKIELPMKIKKVGFSDSSLVYQKEQHRHLTQSQSEKSTKSVETRCDSSGGNHRWKAIPGLNNGEPWVSGLEKFRMSSFILWIGTKTGYCLNLNGEQNMICLSYVNILMISFDSTWHNLIWFDFIFLHFIYIYLAECDVTWCNVKWCNGTHAMHSRSAVCLFSCGVT